MIWGRFVHKHFRLRRTSYAITPQRVLILRGQRLEAHQINQIRVLTWEKKNLLFGEPMPVLAQNQKMQMQAWQGDLQPGLYGIKDIERVYHLLNRLMGHSGKIKPRYT